MEEKKLNKAQKLAEDVLILSRNTLLVNLRFLDLALSQFEMHPIEESTTLTDGRYLLYNPKHILNAFKKQKETCVRNYLHIVLHCIYRHMFIAPAVDRLLWDLACDIAVENVINDLGLQSTASLRENLQKTNISKFVKECGMLTAEKIYAYLKSQNLDPKAIANIRAEFYADNHEIWYMSEAEKQSRFQIGQSGEQHSANESAAETSSGETENGNASQNSSGGYSVSAAADLNSVWQEISQRIQLDIETFSKQRGNTAGNLLQNLKEVNREKYDYTSFLKKFAVLGETMKINDDEFDYIFYTYGLELYEKMPLIEPLEYKEVKRIKEFVIAIDTSGSVMGDEVQAFVQKTYNILKSTESFFGKINLHIIQCDAAIQEHIKITTQEEFDEYLKTMKIKGLGGTDFRPVFRKVDELIKAKEFTNLKGLIYFTDGHGTFPHKKPGYDTAFIFVQDDYYTPEVPPWAIKLILSNND